MASQYKNAPIREALIDLRVELPAHVSTDVLERAHEEINESYPSKKRWVQIEGRFSAGAEVGAATKQSHKGFVFTSGDRARIVQMRLDGFTFSRLRPYGNWEELRSEAQRLWNVYQAIAKPVRTTRVAVRYINQIDIPVSAIDYKDYFRTTPEVSPALSQELGGFFMQLQFPQRDFGGTLILTQAAVPPREPNTHSVVLDIDVFKDGMQEGEDVWQLLEVLRLRKNEFFEGSITEKTRSLFGERIEY